MENTYYKLTRSLGKFRAIKADEIGKDGFYAEIYNDEENKTFSANIYSDGKLYDIGINSWTFSYHIEGTYDNVSTDYKIDAIDPDKKEVSFYNTPYHDEYYMLSEVDVLCSFLNSIFIYCYFKNAEVAYRFNLLLRSLEYNKRFRRYQDEREITLEVVKTQVKFFKEYYQKYIDDCTDRSFMKLIKETVNSAIDVIKEDIEKYKIKD